MRRTRSGKDTGLRNLDEWMFGQIKGVRCQMLIIIALRIIMYGNSGDTKKEKRMSRLERKGNMKNGYDRKKGKKSTVGLSGKNMKNGY